MTELDTRLQRALTHAAPPDTDPLFAMQVILRRRQTVLRRQLLEGFGAACLGAVLAALALQAIDDTIRSASLRLGAGALLAMACGILFAGRYLSIPWLGHLLAAHVHFVCRRCWQDGRARF